MTFKKLITKLNENDYVEFKNDRYDEYDETLTIDIIDELQNEYLPQENDFEIKTRTTDDYYVYTIVNKEHKEPWLFIRVER